MRQHGDHRPRPMVRQGVSMARALTERRPELDVTGRLASCLSSPPVRTRSAAACAVLSQTCTAGAFRRQYANQPGFPATRPALQERKACEARLLEAASDEGELACHGHFLASWMHRANCEVGKQRAASCPGITRVPDHCPRPSCLKAGGQKLSKCCTPVLYLLGFRWPRRRTESSSATTTG